MKKSTELRPVSRNAYKRFIERINIVITDTVKRVLMLDALDKYLAGNRTDYAAALTAECAMAFEMLRFEIDQAITRSEKARSRARYRKTAATIPEESKPEPQQPQAINPSGSDHDMPDEATLTIADNRPAEIYGYNPQPSIARLTRRQRRELMRSTLPKYRWQKPGVNTADR